MSFIVGRAERLLRESELDEFYKNAVMLIHETKMVNKTYYTCWHHLITASPWF